MIRMGFRKVRTSPMRAPSGTSELMLVKLMPLGWPKYGVLVALKNSDRNWTL